MGNFRLADFLDKKKFYNIDFRPNLFNFHHFERTTISRLNCPSYILREQMTEILCLESNPRPQQFLTHLASSLFCFLFQFFRPKKLLNVAETKKKFFHFCPCLLKT